MRLFSAWFKRKQPVSSAQISLFDTVLPSFNELILERKLSLHVEFKSRLRQSWKYQGLRKNYSGSPNSGTLLLPALLEHAPRSIKIALLDWVSLVCRRKSKDLLIQRRTLENLIRQFLAQAPLELGDSKASNTLIKRETEKRHRKLERLEPVGRYFDLGHILKEITDEYFQKQITQNSLNPLSIRITWSSRWGGLSFHRIEHDAQGKAYHLVSISRGYDHPSANERIVGGVVYHECLHAYIPPKTSGRRRIIHSREFRQFEKKYRYYTEWNTWHNTVLSKILRKGPFF